MKKDYTYRYELIDAFRGFALVNMVIYHFCYDIFAVYGLDPVWFTYPVSYTHLTLPTICSV